MVSETVVPETVDVGNAEIDVDAALWLVAVLTYGVGDVATTDAMLDDGNQERNPIVRELLDVAGNEGFVVAKVGFLAGSYAVSRRLPKPVRYGVPIGLAAIGLLAMGNNTLLVTSASAGN